MITRVLFSSPDNTWRVVEHIDTDYDMDDLKGDMFNPKYIADMGFKGTPDDLRADELEFERTVEEQGVYGYELQRWNAEPDHGWEHVDSCWGFIGAYSASNDHYIVDELKGSIKP
jgi:hypothetical protein